MLCYVSILVVIIRFRVRFRVRVRVRGAGYLNLPWPLNKKYCRPLEFGYRNSLG